MPTRAGGIMGAPTAVRGRADRGTRARRLLAAVHHPDRLGPHGAAPAVDRVPEAWTPDRYTRSRADTRAANAGRSRGRKPEGGDRR
jgi:hypothetical protein